MRFEMLVLCTTLALLLIMAVMDVSNFVGAGAISVMIGFVISYEIESKNHDS